MKPWYKVRISRGESPLRTSSPNTRGTSPARQNLVSSFGTNALNSPVNETASHGRQDSGISQISVNDTLKTCDITEFILMYDYIAQSNNDLTVKRGDIVYVDTADQNDQQWLWVYCPQWHKYGYVPRSYVKVPIKTTL
ncbi:hypothetical protein KUTeg_007963 [Tegillarca granosa]|uniref:SH3 domain-containing protein n=1 Tax=Tegillarca granosa TaxID=220873 RepID=A0ABQ9FEP5_TEGGR|nr:hypothetical protein KUTeg_007963 [Tegillarca granosa]